MLNYMDRQTLSQSATDITKELRLSNEDYGNLERGFGLAFATGAITLGFVADRANLRLLYPAVLLAWSAAGFATGWARSFGDLMVCRVALGFFEAGQWPCALSASQRLLSRRDRALGNSLLQSGASLGSMLTPLVVQSLVSDSPGTWRGPFRVIGLMGIGWTLLWLAMIRRGDLARPHADSKGGPEVTTTSRDQFVRRFLALLLVVVAINLCWHFYRAWMPKMLREQLSYERATVNYFTAAFYIATDVGCLLAGAVARTLASRGFSVHGARVTTFFACSLLTALSAIAAFLPRGPLLLGTLLLIAVGALGVFPIYYSMNQDLSARHQGKVAGVLSSIAWFASALMHSQIGRWVDETGSYTAILFGSGLLPLIALLGVMLLWDWPARQRGHSAIASAGAMSGA
jgi:ACS family hexuronate transporter-like MFS transporter